MLDLEVVPESSLGSDQWEFRLGMHFSQAVAIIQSQVGLIKGVQVLYNDTRVGQDLVMGEGTEKHIDLELLFGGGTQPLANPLDIDLIVNLPQDGIRLFFDPIVQRLKLIEIYNMKLVKLKYCSLPFNSPEVLPSIEQIEHSFGATRPGEYNAEKQLFALNFRGLSFYFPVESKFKTGSAHKLGSLQFPTGSSPLVSRMIIYHGRSIEEATAPELPLSCYHGQLYLQKAEVIRGDSFTKGIQFLLIAASHSRKISHMLMEFRRQVLLGDTVQDVATALGAPSRVFYKSEDKMRIHSPNAHRRVTQRKSDYFFNYFTLGVDVLFDARSHLVKKLVLHTNYPGHYNFNMYQRCEFSLLLDDVEVTAYSRWDDLCKQLTPSERPVVLNRASSTNTTNPFGSTFCYGYQDIIFEVMPNNYIASVSIYGDGQPYESELHGEQQA